MTRTRALVVSLHDVSPLTQPDCAVILEDLKAAGIDRCSLLVIPNHHHRAAMISDQPFVDWLRAQAAVGHEIVMHGYFHQRNRRENEDARTRFTTRLYTADEGECFDLSLEEATALVNQSHADFHQLGLDPAGFIAPAWLLSAGTEQALHDLHCAYTTRLGSVLDLRNGTIHRSQSLVWSVRSGWRRTVSLLWNAFLYRRLRENPLLRISIHPVDRHYVTVWQQIMRLTARALADRAPVTYHAWLALWRSQVPDESRSSPPLPS